LGLFEASLHVLVFAPERVAHRKSVLMDADSHPTRWMNGKRWKGEAGS
jgi:hypothetical protein